MNLYPNLDFEYEYLRGERATARVVRAQNERWSHVMRLMSGWRHASPQISPKNGPWLPWGVTPSFVELNPEGEFASCDVVERVNSKVFSCRLEKELGIALPGSRIVQSVEVLEDALLEVAGTCLVKNPWGVAGRERLQIDGVLNDKAARWAARQFRLVDELVVEPWVRRTRDWSLQFDLGLGADFVGACELVTDAAGNHRGHRLGAESPPEGILAAASQAVERVHEAGYRGPLGIDAFEGFLGTDAVTRPLCEINARMSFGRLALELEAHVGGPFVWWHPPRRSNEEKLVPVTVNAPDGTYRLPEFADPEGKSGTLVVVGDDEPWTTS